MVVALLVRVHRYLGIATGPLMVMWCLSGAVMMYAPLPEIGGATAAPRPPADLVERVLRVRCQRCHGGRRLRRLRYRDARGTTRPPRPERSLLRSRRGHPGGRVGVTEAALTADSFAGPTRFLGILVHPVHDRSPSVRRRTGWCRTHGIRGAAGLRRSHHAWRPASFVASTHRDLRLGAA